MVGVQGRQAMEGQERHPGGHGVVADMACVAQEFDGLQMGVGQEVVGRDAVGQNEGAPRTQDTDDLL